MIVKYEVINERVAAALSDDGDWRLFNGVADAILRKFSGKLVEHLDGFDERYWDIEIDGQVVTLHLQYCTGISLFPENQQGNDLVREIGSYLEGVEPRRLFREAFYLRNFFRIRSRR